MSERPTLADLTQPNWLTYREAAEAVPIEDPPNERQALASLLLNASHQLERTEAERDEERWRADQLETALREGAHLYDGTSKGFALRSWQEHAKSVLADVNRGRKLGFASAGTADGDRPDARFAAEGSTP